MKRFLLFFALAVWLSATAQDWPLKKIITAKKSLQTFRRLPVFTFVSNKTVAQRGSYQELKLAADFIPGLWNQKPEAIQLTIPLSETESITVEMVRYVLGNVKFTANNTDVLEDVELPLTYRGVVVGEQNKNTVTLTVTRTSVSLVAAFADKDIQVSKAAETNEDGYRLYNSKKISLPVPQINCGTSDNTPSPADRNIQSGKQNRTMGLQDKCVNVFVDCFDSLYLSKGNNMQATIDFVTDLFNLVATGYLNEQINVQMMGVNVWTTMDPYRGDSSDVALADLKAYWKDGFWGNICVGLDFSTTSKGRGGLAPVARVKGLAPATCTSEGNYACGYCDMNFNGDIRGFPSGPNVSGPQVEVVMHEMGHMLGSKHTHWCGWQLTPTTTGAIDSCFKTEGGCPPGPQPGPAGGTVMSYCHLSGSGSFIKFSNGFGPLPGAAIRNFVTNNSCIPLCTACLIGSTKAPAVPASFSKRKKKFTAATLRLANPTVFLRQPFFAPVNKLSSPISFALLTSRNRKPIPANHLKSL